ncbi:MAG: hypothetical protein ACI4XJ_03160 [Eubacteriales bacterium]
MTEQKYTSTLEQLIQYAKSIGDTPSIPFTAERYLIAVIDLIEGEFKIERYPMSSKRILQEMLGDDSNLSQLKAVCWIT